MNMLKLKKFSKVDIKQNYISTVILSIYGSFSSINMRSAPFARKSGCLHNFVISVKVTSLSMVIKYVKRSKYSFHDFIANVR